VPTRRPLPYPRGIGIVLALWGLPATSVMAAEQDKYAVFVGINDYMEYEDEPGRDLQGAESDALLMREVLIERWGLAEANTLTLLSREATKAAIHLAITEWLASRAGPDDLAIFYFAGHGAQAFDLDGDEPDGLDETLAPTDILANSSANDIRDDDFRMWLSTVPASAVVILDSCHSGTATRGSEMRTRSLERPLPPEDGNEPEAVRQRFDRETMADGGASIVELAGAAPNQSALEGSFPTGDGGIPAQHGAFTTYLVQKLRAATESTTYEEVMAAVAARLLRDDLVQVPQLTGAGAKALFAPGR